MASRIVVRKTSMMLAREIGERLALSAWEVQKMGTLRHATLVRIALALDLDHLGSVPNDDQTRAAS